MNSNSSLQRPGRQKRRFSGARYLSLLLLILTLASLGKANAQTAFISDAWWTFQQDCDGDGCFAGTLPGDIARLNWVPAVTNCNGTLTVYEVVSQRPCGSGTWTSIYTNAPHSITGCRSLGLQHLDIQMGGSCSCRDFRIQIFRNGQSLPDYARSSTNDVDLSQHREELLLNDSCLDDFFAGCVSLSGSSGSQSDITTYSTKEPGEPDHAGNPGGHSIWFCWTAPTNTPVTFDTLGSGFDTLLAVYTGSDVANLTLVTNNDDIAGWTNRMSRVTFTPVAGTTYHIAVDGFGGASGIVVLNWNQTGAALPDLIIWAPAVSPIITVEPFGSSDCEVLEGCLTVGAHRLLRFNAETRNIGGGDLIVGSPATNSLFVWASCHGHYHFEQYMEYNLLDTNGDIAAAGHKVGFCLLDDHPWSPTANPNSKYDCNFQGIQVGWADVYPASLPCQYIEISSVPPGQYVLQMIVNPDNLIAEANVDNNMVLVPLTIPPTNCTSTPLNDDFSNAVAVTTSPSSFSEFNNCADKEPGEPNHAGNAGGHSLWYEWTADSDQTAVITTKRSNFDTLLAVYTGSAVSGLSLVASNDNVAGSSSLQSQVSFPATAETTYYIAVDGKSGATGTAFLNINPPPNDDFADRFLISGTSGTTNGYTVGASKEFLEPAHSFDVGGHSIWYQWTAPASGPVDFNTLGSSFDTTLAVYTNTVVTNLTLMASNDDDAEGGGLLTSRLSFYAVAGRTYQIAVDGFGGEWGNVALSWNMESRLEISQLPDGGFKLNLIGVDWQRYTLLGSTNLLTWNTNAAAITMSGGGHEYTNAPLLLNQFYKARREP